MRAQLWERKLLEERVQKFAENSSFQVIWEILNALMEQDADLADAVKGLGRIGGKHSGSLQEYDKYFKFMNAGSKANIQDLIKVKVLNRFVSVWDTMFARLCEYQAIHNTTMPDKKLEPELYKWVIQQRGYKNLLPRNRIAQLNSINFEWPMNSDDKWLEHFNNLLNFQKEFGHLTVPSREPKFAFLHKWLMHNKWKYKNNLLPPDQAQKLKDLGIFSTTREKMLEEQWMARYDELIKYKKKHKNLFVPQRSGEGLGKWCNKQRIEYKSGKLSPTRYELLHKIGFSFNPVEDLWQRRLKLYQDARNDGFKTLSTELLEWIKYQRKAYKKGILSDEKIKVLQENDFSFEERGRQRAEDGKFLLTVV